MAENSVENTPQISSVRAMFVATILMMLGVWAGYAWGCYDASGGQSISKEIALAASYHPTASQTGRR